MIHASNELHWLQLRNNISHHTKERQEAVYLSQKSTGSRLTSVIFSMFSSLSNEKVCLTIETSYGVLESRENGVKRPGNREHQVDNTREQGAWYQKTIEFREHWEFSRGAKKKMTEGAGSMEDLCEGSKEFWTPHAHDAEAHYCHKWLFQCFKH